MGREAEAGMGIRVVAIKVQSGGTDGTAMVVAGAADAGVAAHPQRLQQGPPVTRTA